MIPIGLAAILWLEQPAAKPVLIPTSVVLTGPPVKLVELGPVNPIPQTMSVSSTSYCQSGTMASGLQTYVGAAAGNIWPLGTRLLVISGAHRGATVTIEDRIGWGSQLDFFTWSCADALKYGREQIEVEALDK